MSRTSDQKFFLAISRERKMENFFFKNAKLEVFSDRRGVNEPSKTFYDGFILNIGREGKNKKHFVQQGFS